MIKNENNSRQLVHMEEQIKIIFLNVMVTTYLNVNSIPLLLLELVNLLRGVTQPGADWF